MGKNLLKLALALLLFLSAGYSQAQHLIYSSPKDKSLYNMENTIIILSFHSDDNPDPHTIRLKVQGSKSGYHKGVTKILNSNPTKISFTPESKFTLGEKVTVTGYNHSDYFVFYIREQIPPGNMKTMVSERLNMETKSLKPVENPYPTRYYPLDTIPELVINQYGQTASGNLFLINFNNLSSLASYLMILNDDGSPKFARRLRFRGFDFKRQNDKFVYWDEDHYKYMALDTGYNVVDSFTCANGYITDFHECILEPDNSAWLMSYDPQVVDMSLIYPNGKTNATVTCLLYTSTSPRD